MSSKVVVTSRELNPKLHFIKNNTEFSCYGNNIINRIILKHKYCIHTILLHAEQLAFNPCMKS